MSAIEIATTAQCANETNGSMHGHDSHPQALIVRRQVHMSDPRHHFLSGFLAGIEH
jgi:hypothetical protein